ncbi:MAG TPA: hypothetical protein DCZ30_07280 [Clostridiales bacterium]|nr:hypothetical protein [Clostridiales bacterium]
MKNILFVCAMKREAELIAKKLKLDKLPENLYKKDNISLLITGIGKQKTAISLTKYLCENVKPQLIINVGYAGSTDIKVGEWVCITRSYNYEWEIPGEEKYSMLDFGNQSLEIINSSGIKKVECYSAESFVTKTSLKKSIAFDMEVHSIAILCDMYKIPLMSLKKISDNLSLNDYYDNLKEENVFELESCLELLDGKIL